MIVSFINREHLCKLYYGWKITCNTDKLIMCVKGIQYSLDTCFIIDGEGSSGPAVEWFNCETIVFTSITVAEISVNELYNFYFFQNKITGQSMIQCNGQVICQHL